MTRKEEIIQQSIKEFPRFAERRIGFIAGSEWSDEHPQKGLIDIDKACEWLDEHTFSELNLDFGYSLQVKEFVDNFRNSMEE